MAMKSNSFSGLFLVAAILLVASSVAESTWAQQGVPVAVTMKSSHQFKGRIDPVNGFSPMIVPLGAANCYRISDGLRRVYVNENLLVNEEAVPLNYVEVSFPIWQDSIDWKRSSIGILNWANGFNEYGHRVINVATKHGARNYVQGVTKITPRYVELSSLRKEKDKTSYGMSIGSGAVPVEVIRNLLRNQITRGDSPVEYEEIFTYFLQAEQYGEALKELDLIERRFPDRKEQVEKYRNLVRQAEARQVVQDIKLRISNGQTKLARELGGPQMNKDGVAQQVLLELQELMSGLEQEAQKVVDVQREVTELVKRYQQDPDTELTPDQETMLGQFLAELESELTPSNVKRMDSYLVQAPDAAQKDQEKVALAISGWLMGSNNATPNFALAQSLFQVRSLVRSYLLNRDSTQRQAIIAAIKKTESGSNHNFIASILAQMMPPEHEAATAGYTGEVPIEFTVSVPGTQARPGLQKFRVLVHLPVEYDPYRRYPLLLTLPDIGMPVEKQLTLFNGPYIANVGRVGRASRNGVIVASVQWANPGQTTCGYSAREHATVLKAMRACFRKFQIDTDRVFLHGNGKGGNLVYDIGLAHPEHFAALIPVGGTIEKFAKVHGTNRGIPLSIYAVVGERDQAVQAANLQSWNKWLLSGRYVKLILVEYIGRLANESFPDDIEAMFEWMQFQQRRLPDPAGVEFSVNSLRPWDNYYWFLQLNGFPRANVMWPQLWEDGKLKALNIDGEMKPEGEVNHFVVKPAKAGRSMTLWLSDDYVNFEKAVRISGRGKNFRESVSPSVRIMLEDARTRGDRLHPYWARIDCNSGRWKVVE